jgi:hypothetical protein
MILRHENQDVDIVDIFEQMLQQRASKGIRPVLYVSSYTDLECSLVMLLDESNHQESREVQQPASRGVGYHVVMN